MKIRFDSKLEKGLCITALVVIIVAALTAGIYLGISNLFLPRFILNRVETTEHFTLDKGFVFWFDMYIQNIGASGSYDVWVFLKEEGTDKLIDQAKKTVYLKGDSRDQERFILDGKMGQVTYIAYYWRPRTFLIKD